MAGRFSRSWDIFKTSASVLNKNKVLLVFPFFSSIAAVFIIGAFGAGILSLETPGAETTGGDLSNTEAALIFALYLSLYTVMIFFNTALVASVARHFEGGEATIGYGLGVAWSKIGPILGYAVIAATVGLLLRALERRLGFIGQIVIRLLGAAWTIATFLVVPLLVHRDLGPMDAVRESAVLLKKTWGENIIANAGMGLLFALLYLPLLMLFFASGFTVLFGSARFGIEAGSALSFSLLGASLLSFILLGLVHAAITGIYGAALYRYSTGAGEDTGAGEFSPEMLGAAFAAK